MATTLYYARGATSFGPHVVLEEIGHPYEARLVDPAKGDNKTPEYLKLHPRGHVPVLVQDDFVLTESTAILCYLGDSNPAAGLIPRAGTRDRARLHEWLAFLTSTVHIAYRQVSRPERFTTEASAHESIRADGRTRFAHLAAEVDERLAAAGGPWVLGASFSVVDPYLQVFHRLGLRIEADLAPYKHWTAHSQKVLERPTVQRVMARERITPSGVVKE